MSVQHNQFNINWKKTTYFNLHCITTPIKKSIIFFFAHGALVRFALKFLMPSQFLVFVMSTINESSKYDLKRVKLQKDSRLVTNRRSKHNCANHIHFIRLLDSKKGLAIEVSISANSCSIDCL